MIFFRRKHKPGQEPVISKPFYGDEIAAVLRKLVTAWKVGALTGWLFAVGGLVGMIIVGSQGRDILHIVEVYPGAQVVYRGSVPTTEIKDVWVEAQIRQWIDLVRRRTDDPVNDKIMRQRALDMTTGKAKEKLDEYYKRVVDLETGELKHNRMRVNVHVLEDERPNSLTRDTTAQYRIGWEEEWTPTIGKERHVIRLEGIFQVEHRFKTPNFLGQFKIDVKDMRVSPLGVYISYFDWDEAVPVTASVVKP